ncbi:MAG: cytosolic protein [Verrucomicrobia bacterium]|nr:MAG: cytosolic protein [Verrucomicrobiota bacterium]
MNCKQTTNQTGCNCTYEPCSRKGMCCDCLRYHLSSRELPACCFSPAAEATFDRSFEHFARLVASHKI